MTLDDLTAAERSVIGKLYNPDAAAWTELHGADLRTAKRLSGTLVLLGLGRTARLTAEGRHLWRSERGTDGEGLVELLLKQMGSK